MPTLGNQVRRHDLFPLQINSLQTYRHNKLHHDLAQLNIRPTNNPPIKLLRLQFGPVRRSTVLTPTIIRLLLHLLLQSQITSQ